MPVQGQSDELTAFYRAYVAWLDAGAPKNYDRTTNPYDFHRGVGLCGNLRTFCYSHNCYSHHTVFTAEMIKQFMDAGLNKEYPFNAWSKDWNSMTTEISKDTCYLNPKRIQWVRDHC